MLKEEDKIFKNLYNELGWKIEDSVILAEKLSEHGVDVVDCSAGGIATAPLFRVHDSGKPLKTNMDRGPGFQVPYASKVKEEAKIKTMAVGVIVDPQQAESILVEEKADLIALGRQHLFNPFWTNQAREIANQNKDFKEWPQQYRWWLSKWKSALSDINEKP